MGSYRLKLSDMIPNPWIYKFKDMGRSRNHGSKKKLQNPTSPVLTTKTEASKTKQSDHSYPRKSYYFSREIIPSDRFYISSESQRKSSKKPSRTRNIRTSSVSSGCNCRATIWAKTESPTECSTSSYLSPSSSSFSNSSSGRKEFRSACVLKKESFDNVVDEQPFVVGFNKFSELELPPIITKPSKFKERNTMKKGQKNSSPVRRHSVNSPGVRLRVNSPRIGCRRIQGHSQKSVSSSSSSSSRKSQLSDSFAVVKSSFDPRRDFRDSMVEMIMENDIRASKDLEDLLACYLCLNSDEYHDLIIQIFRQIWSDLGM